MGKETLLLDNRFMLRWVGANIIGWLIGFVLVIVLAQAWELIGGGAQFMVGVGMGAGVGVLQSRVIAPWVTSARSWFLASMIGMGTPFLLWDIGVGLGMNWPLSTLICVLSGSLFVGILQHRLFRPYRPRVKWWVAACVVGWIIPEGIIVLSDLGLLPGRWDLLSIAVLFFGGIIVGGVTGVILPWIQDEPAGLTSKSNRLL